MDFVVVDVETANPDVRSICQIGIAAFRDGRLAEGWQSLVNPQARFDAGNIAIHGIRSRDVRDAPTFPELFEEIRARFEGRIVGSHTPFDRHAICGAAELHGLPAPACRWLDTAKVVRRAWPEFSKKGYGLANLTRHFGIEFRHHDALEDARAAGEILLRAIRESGITVEQWLLHTTTGTKKPALSPNPDGPLYGEIVTFCGGLRRERDVLATKAAAAGCRISTALRDTTTLLVVADSALDAAAEARGAKHRHAEVLIARGLPLRIVGESEFLRLIVAAEPA